MVAFVTLVQVQHHCKCALAVDAQDLTGHNVIAGSVSSDGKPGTALIADLLKKLSVIALRRQRDKIPVTYEDPRYSNHADIQDVT